MLSPPGIEMEIVNSCEKNNGGCSHHCEHTTNGPLCSCNQGYQLDQDRKTCVGKNCSLLSMFSSSFLISIHFLTLCVCLPGHLLTLTLLTHHCVPPQIVTSVSIGSPAAVTSVETTQVATSAVAELVTGYTQTAVAAMVRVLVW